VLLFRLATLPFLAAAAFLLFKLLESPLTFILGHDATGRIREVRPYWRGADGRRFDVTFTYDAAAGIRETGYGRIDTGGAAPPPVGAALPIRALVLGPFRRAELRDGDAGASGLVCGGLFATVWCGGVAVFSAVAWLGPVFSRRLLRDGYVATGTVTGKRERRSGRNLYREILYQFRARDDVACSGISQVSPEVFEQMGAGKTVTVIYRPSSPARSTLYEASDFEIVASR
jgi:hypothetical protein